MKSTGITRKIDELGRIVIPKELRRSIGIDQGTSLEFFVNGEQIVIQKTEFSCVFCGNQVDTNNEVLGKPVCEECLTKIK